ncbi:hypothetical protein KY308_01050 [Candidatus Woesearchaeota archaeon]|nr:hypothetical protein [Candidatus Woesearchaeota archaeon]
METKAFTVQNWKLRLLKHPIEDAYKTDDQTSSIAVADGITRDPLLYLPMGQLGKLKFALAYPKESPAKVAANLFCKFFPITLNCFDTKDEKAVRSAFDETNKFIKNWNEMHLPYTDYLLRDYAGCVASAATEQKGIVSWGFITDCGVAVFDEKGNLKFKTEDESPHRLDKYIWQDPKIKGKTWSQPEVRKRIRSHYRNNPDEIHSFGALTGQEEAMHYVRTGSQEIKPNEHLAVYSDGLEPIILSGEFADKLRNRDMNSLERLCQKRVKTEGTLVIRKFD